MFARLLATTLLVIEPKDIGICVKVSRGGATQLGDTLCAGQQVEAQERAVVEPWLDDAPPLATQFGEREVPLAGLGVALDSG